MSHSIGILPCQNIRNMIKAGHVTASQGIVDDQIQPASIDLRLGNYAYPVSTSFLPGNGAKVLEKLGQIDKNFDDYKIDLSAGALLHKNQVYVIPLQESLALSKDVAGFANPKSSTGRLDILTRLIADGSRVFDQLEKGYSGQLYIEVAPRSFDIVVKSGDRLNQLRFRRESASVSQLLDGYISKDEWQKLIDDNQIVYIENGNQHSVEQDGMLHFSVDLKGSGKDGELIGYRTKKHSGRIDLQMRDYAPLDFWEPVYSNKNASLILDPDQFYILMTREAIAVPSDYAAEMVPYDTRAGEFRVHYAGFFDPGFGWDANTKKAGSSRGVLEVRSHEVPFLLEHGQTVGWLRYERMAEKPDMLYGGVNSNYQGQGLKLSKQFKSL